MWIDLEITGFLLMSFCFGGDRSLSKNSCGVSEMVLEIVGSS